MTPVLRTHPPYHTNPFPSETSHPKQLSWLKIWWKSCFSIVFIEMLKTENLTFFSLCADGDFLGPQTSTCVPCHGPPGLYFIKSFLKHLLICWSSHFEMERKQKKDWHLQVWAGWLVLVTASLLLPIYLGASLLAARHCTPQHSIVLPLGHIENILDIVDKSHN